METLPHFKNRRKSQQLIPSPFIVWCTFTVFLGLIAISTSYALQSIESTLHEIQNAPLDPQAPSSLAFIPFYPDRHIQTDPLTKASAPSNRLERRVKQYRKLTPAEDLLLIPMTAEPKDLTSVSHKELNLWSKTLAPEFYYDGFYKILSSEIGLENFVMRNDLISIPTSPFDRWVRVSPNSIFLGTTPAKPANGQYKIDYYSFVVPKLIILGSIDQTGAISPRKIFVDNPKLDHPKQILIGQIQRFQTSILSLDLILITVLLLLAIRESTNPTASRELFTKLLAYSQYDLIFSPLILLIPPTQVGAMIFCLCFMIYGTCKVFLTKSMILIQRERINLYR